jgi:hypothetical protein
MFLVKSAFWLTVAFIAIKPGFDFPGAAQAASVEALAVGQQILVSQIISNDCDTIQCVGGKAAALALIAPFSTPSVGSPMHDSPTNVLAPVPRPRLDRTG